jgi:bifunctional NMN adenylyltransferase/nudix hydrolase
MTHTKRYDFLVFIGRFQPFHVGHVEVIQSALKIADKVLVLIGSANQPRTIKNPWTYMDRVGMIFAGLNLPPEDKGRVVCAPLRDQAYNDQKWVASVQSIVDDQVRISCVKNANIGITGHAKDSSSYYLKMFPQWDLVEHEMNQDVNATDLRKLLFEGKNVMFLKGVLPRGSFEYVDQFTHTPEYKDLIKEYNHIQKYRKSWEAAPYAPTFVTTDAIVIQSGHILLVQRDASPGAGLWALPGGFLEVDERIIDGMLRELREETKLKVPAPVLRGSIKAREVFDDPTRSMRGRTITHAFLIELPPGELPQVKPQKGEARQVKWVKITDLDESVMFEDHFPIIQRMLGQV